MATEESGRNLSIQINKAKQFEADAARGDSMAYISAFKCYYAVLTEDKSVNAEEFLQYYKSSVSCIERAIEAGVRSEPYPGELLQNMKNRTAPALMAFGKVYEASGKSIDKAAEMYLLAIDGNSTAAMLRMFSIYHTNYGNNEKALEYLRMADRRGSTEAASTALKWANDEYRDGDRNLAIKVMTVAAEAGNADGMYRLATFYYDAADIDKCKQWLKRAADAGNKEAASKLSMLGEYSIQVKDESELPEMKNVPGWRVSAIVMITILLLTIIGLVVAVLTVPDNPIPTQSSSAAAVSRVVSRVVSRMPSENNDTSAGSFDAESVARRLSGKWYCKTDYGFDMLEFGADGSIIISNYRCEAMPRGQDTQDGNNIYYNDEIYEIVGGVRHDGTYTIRETEPNVYSLAITFKADEQYPEEYRKTIAVRLPSEDENIDDLQMVYNGETAVDLHYVRGNIEDLRLYF